MQHELIAALGSTIAGRGSDCHLGEEQEPAGDTHKGTCRAKGHRQGQPGLSLLARRGWRE